jgi:hypothetical protein
MRDRPNGLDDAPVPATSALTYLTGYLEPAEEPP